MHLLYYIILAVVLVAGLYINLVNAPGLWLMVLATVIYAIVTHFQHAGLRTIIAICCIAGVAEVCEFLVTGASAKKAGANRRGLWGALIGSIVGGLFFTAILPIPIIGTIFGVCLGTFIGAIVGELWGGTEVGSSVWIGLGAAKGRLMGIFTKLLFGIAILATVLITAMPPMNLRHAAGGHPIAPATLPAGKL